MLRLVNIKLPADKKITKEILLKKASKILRIPKNKIKKINISKQSIDSRNKKAVLYVLSADVELINKNDEKYALKQKNVFEVKPFCYEIPKKNSDIKPIVIGFGPAGMLASLILAKSGLKPIVFERGKSVENRQKDIEFFFKTGILNTESNIQFGEGGAGTFSDGKLTTGIKDKRINYVLEEFVKAGAPKEILYLSKPHIGTDKLIHMVKNIRKQIEELGGKIYFEHKLEDIIIKNNKISEVVIKNEKELFSVNTDNIILAIGHSARDTFEMLAKKPILILQKPFSVGVRIEHNQEMINKSQYGEFAKYLPSADYKLAVHLKNGRSAYTFCMCPGGYVVAAASEEKMLVTNGMSYYSRNGKNSNSALLIGVYPSDFKSDSPLSGVEFQRNLEHKAYIAGGGNFSAPIQTVGDILADKKSSEIFDIKPTYAPNTTPADMSKIFPDYIYESIKMGITEMDKKINGFAYKGAVLTAVESRSSSPVRIERSDSLSSSVEGIYPCGEGCGYAGGIVSAAVDGIKCAEAIIEKIKS